VFGTGTLARRVEALDAAGVLLGTIGAISRQTQPSIVATSMSIGAADVLKLGTPAVGELSIAVTDQGEGTVDARIAGTPNTMKESVNSLLDDKSVLLCRVTMAGAPYLLAVRVRDYVDAAGANAIIADYRQEVAIAGTSEGFWSGVPFSGRAERPIHTWGAVKSMYR
jgi:hypothetical protein